MGEYTPTLIVLYDLGSSEPRRVAEFRLTSSGEVALIVTDPNGCLVAERWYDRGVEVYDPTARVRPDEGPRFLRALLQSPGMSYYRVVDESPEEQESRSVAPRGRRRPNNVPASPRRRTRFERQRYPAAAPNRQTFDRNVGPGGAVGRRHGSAHRQHRGSRCARLPGGRRTVLASARRGDRGAATTPDARGQEPNVELPAERCRIGHACTSIDHRSQVFRRYDTCRRA